MFNEYFLIKKKSTNQLNNRNGAKSIFLLIYLSLNIFFLFIFNFMYNLSKYQYFSKVLLNKRKEKRKVQV